MEIPTKSRHNCSFCNYTCTQLGHLESHMRKHTRERPYICDKCNRVFSTQTHLNVHVKNLHRPRAPKIHTETFKISLCPYEGHSQLNYERHIIDHTGKRRFHCVQPDCKYAAKTSVELRQHDINKHRNERKFKCPFPNCGYRGKSKRLVSMHYVTHNEYKPFACDIEGCTFQARKKSVLKIHKRIVHHGGHKPFACSQCEYSTTSMSSLKTHGVTHRKEKPFKCDFSGCSYATKRKTNLNLHIEHRHTAKTFKCEFSACSFVGPSERFLEVHKKNVHSEKIYKCPCCPYRGAFPFRLRNHMERHSKNQSVLFCQNKSCTMHRKEHEPLKHRKQVDEENPGCPAEDNHNYGGSSRSAVQHNLQLHDTTGRPFHCPLCSKRFSKDASLLVHLGRHTVEKLFKCPVCNYECARKSTLITHVRASHSNVFPEFLYDRNSYCNHCHFNFGCAAGIAVHTMRVKTPVIVLTRLQLKCEL